MFVIKEFKNNNKSGAAERIRLNLQDVNDRTFSICVGTKIGKHDVWKDAKIIVGTLEKLGFLQICWLLR